MNQKAFDTIDRLSAFMYGESTGPEVARRLRALAEELEPRLGKAGALGESSFSPERLSEKDALLISYGDMISADPASAPGSSSALARLRSFLQGRALGLFSYVHILPFFPYSSDDGFSVIDYRAVDPRIGGWQDVEALGSDFKLAFDLVLNHGSAQSEWFKAFLEGDRARNSWYLTREASYDYSRVFRPRTHPLLTPFEKSDGSTVHVWTTFSADQVDFDFGNPDVLLEFARVFLEYVLRGARLVRLDAIAFLWKEDGTSCLHHPKTHAAVKLLRALSDALGLDAIILTETNVAHAENISYYGDGDEAHMVYNFALPPLLLHAAVSGDAGPLRRWAGSLPPSGEGPVFLNFTASHDGIGVGAARAFVPEAEFERTIVELQNRGGKVSFKSAPTGPIPYELNCVYLDAVAPRGADPAVRAKAFLATQAVMLALAGMPAVYFHSLVGSENWTEGVAELGYNRAINRRKPPISELERKLSDPDSLQSMVYEGYSRLLSFRSSRASFAPSRPQRILDTEGAVFALVRGPDASGDSVLCAHNLGPEPALIEKPEEFGGGVLELAPWCTEWISSSTKESLCI